MTSNDAALWLTQGVWRFAPALIALLLLLAAEALWPWRRARRDRWAGNFSMGALSTVSVAVLPLASMTAAAHWAGAQQFGLMHALGLTGFSAGALAFVLLDLSIYFQHRLLHRLPWLWRLHRVHHLDPMLDASSGLRFHPFEAAGSALYKAAVVLLLGASPAAAVSFALALNLASLFTHANVRLPRGVDQALRWLLITPAVHRVHHSTVPDETQSNFGFLLSIWDRLFSSYRAQSIRGEQLQLGVLNTPEQTKLANMLCDPFRNPTQNQRVR